MFGNSVKKNNKRKMSNKAKQRVNKKTYSRKSGAIPKQFSSGKQSNLDDQGSPNKLNKKTKSIVNNITLSENEYSNYIKNKHVNSIVLNACGGSKHSGQWKEPNL